MRIGTVLITVAGVIASVLIATLVPVEYQVYLAEFAGLAALGLGVWKAHSDSQSDATNDRPA